MFQIGDDYSAQWGSIVQGTCQAECPELCSDDDWQYLNPGWRKERTVNVTCGKIWVLVVLSQYRNENVTILCLNKYPYFIAIFIFNALLMDI